MQIFQPIGEARVQIRNCIGMGGGDVRLGIGVGSQIEELTLSLGPDGCIGPVLGVEYRGCRIGRNPAIFIKAQYSELGHEPSYVPVGETPGWLAEMVGLSQ